MSSKNIRLPWRVTLDPVFLFFLRILFFIALIQFVAAGFILGPQWVSSVASHLAKKERPQQTALLLSKPEVVAVATNEKTKEGGMTPLQSAKNTKTLQTPFSSQAALLEKETVSKTVSSGMESGLQAGECLSIISIQHLPGAEGEHVLKIAMKALSHEAISIPEVKVQVYFYDQVEGEVVASKSPITSRWLNAAVDWKNGEPQLLQVTYQPDNNNPDAHYLGYIVAVYYKGELQAYRADPPAITNQFPIRVYIGHDDF
ncbi:MAG: hypothetical protein ACOYK6_04885 [Chthoniobacterales bacterium]